VQGTNSCAMQLLLQMYQLRRSFVNAQCSGHSIQHPHLMVHCCRPEMKFDGLPALMAQIRTDIGADLHPHFAVLASHKMPVCDSLPMPYHADPAAIRCRHRTVAAGAAPAAEVEEGKVQG
jgi:hypothetical protein